MSVNRNFGRTLSGATDIQLDNLNLPSRINTIRVNGFSGNSGDVLGKDINNKLVFQTLSPFVIDPDSIDGSKLTNDITFSTTRSITANGLTSTGNLDCDGDFTLDGAFNFNGDLNIDDLTVDNLTIDAGAVGLSGINLNQHAITGDYANLNIAGNTGNIICNQLTTKSNVLLEDTLSVVGDITTTGEIEIEDNDLIVGGDTTTENLDASGVITGTSNIAITGNYTTTNGNITTTNGNISAPNGLITSNNILNNDNIVCSGIVYADDIEMPSSGAAKIVIDGATGDFDTNGKFETTAGDIKSGSGDIIATNGTIHANNSYVRGNDLRFLNSIQFGNSLPSIFTIDNGGNIDTATGIITTGHTGSFVSEEYALKLTTASSHALIGGSLKVNGTIFGTFEGDVTETHIDGQSLKISDLGSGGATGIQVEDGYDLDLYSDSGTTKTINLDSSTGNITITGTLFGNVDGTITEKHIDGQSLKISDLGSAGDTGIQVEDGYDIDLYSDSGTTKTINLDSSTGNINITGGGSSVLTFNDASSNIQATYSGFGIGLRNATHPTINHMNIADSFIALNQVGSANKSIIIEQEVGVSFLTGANVYNLTIHDDGEIDFTSGTGRIDGYSVGSNSSILDNTTPASKLRLNQTNFKNAKQEISMSKPTARLQRTFTATSTDWIDINDALICEIITDDLTATNFIITWTYYAIKDDGMRMWAKLFDPEEASPEDADQPAFLNNTKQVLFDGGADKTGQHTATFTMRNVSANTNRKISVCIWNIVNAKSFINFYIGPTTFSGDPPTGGSASSYAYGGMTLQQQKLFDGSSSNASPSGWSAPS